MNKTIYDAIIISDLHLGSTVCQSEQILKFLYQIENDELLTKQLILNGDVFDSWDFRRLCKQHWKILSAIRSMSDHVQVTWINGNHDGPAEIVSNLLGCSVAEEIIFQSGDKRILALHGHSFDDFITDHPIVTFVADRFYQWLQKIHIYWSRHAKKCSKTFLRCSKKIEQDAKIYAKKLKCDIVCCGHTHLELEHENYFNSGCWTELPCSYLSVYKGQVKLNHFEEKEDENNFGD